MKNFIKTSIILALTALSFQSCESEETREDIVSDEQKITPVLTEKIVATATNTTLNDYDFFVNNVNSSNCDFLSTLCYFNNTQGDYYQFIIMEDSFDNWLSEYNTAKLEAFNTTGIEFTNEDFVLGQMDIENGFFGLATREDFLKYFENCNTDFISTIEFGVPFLDINSNCNDAEILLTLDDENITITDPTDLDPIEIFLNTVNENNNTNYTLDDILVSSIVHEAPNGEEVILYEKENILNYFDDCLFNRSINNEECLKFVYPLDVNRFSLELEEVITTSIENDEDLIETFSIDVGELGFVFPISLVGQDGSVLEIISNEALENALDNSATYCN